MKNFDKIKNMIQNYEGSFTAKNIVIELGLCKCVVREHLRTLAIRGEIFQIDFANHAKVYISKNEANKSDHRAISSYYQKIKEYLMNYEGSFTARKIASELNMAYDVVRRYLRILASEGEIIQIELNKHTKVYIPKSKIEKLNHVRCKTSYEIIRDFVENSNEPIIAKKLAIELDLPLHRIWFYIYKLLEEGHIEYMGFNKRSKIFISKKCQESHIPIDTSKITTYEKILSYIKNLSEPFSADQIAHDFGISVNNTQGYLKKYLAKGYIKLNGKIKKKHIYSSNSYHGKILLLSGRDKVRNYIYYANFPFTVERIAKDIGLTKDYVRSYVPKLLAEGYIKMIGNVDYYKKVYIHNKLYGKNETKKE